MIWKLEKYTPLLHAKALRWHFSVRNAGNFNRIHSETARLHSGIGAPDICLTFRAHASLAFAPSAIIHGEKAGIMVENSLRDKRILVVDDEPQLRRMIVDVLRAEGFCAISQAGSVMEALAVFRETNPQLALLDVMLPDGDGFTLCEYLRSLSAGTPLPVMFLTAKNETEDRLAGLRTGADDYIPKPFSPQELVLRVCAVLRRCYPAQPDTLQLAACTLDLSNAEAIRPNGERVSLTVKERDILTALARNANRIVTSEALCDAAWGDSFGYGQSLMTHVRRIREKIEADPSHPASLVTAKGLGYKLVVQG